MRADGSFEVWTWNGTKFGLLRKERGLSLADRRFKQGAILRWQKGSTPSDWDAVRLMKILNCEPEDLFDWSEDNRRFRLIERTPVR